MAHNLMKYEDIQLETIQEGKYFLSIFISVGQIMILLEFIFYIIMFYSLKEKDKSLANIIQDDIIKVKSRIEDTSATLLCKVLIAEAIEEKCYHFGRTIHHLCDWDHLWNPTTIFDPSRINRRFLWTRSYPYRHDVLYGVNHHDTNCHFTWTSKTLL